MIETIDDTIDRFQGYFADRVRAIKSTDGSYRVIRAKIQYVALMDALARFVCPEEGNRKRFVDTLESFGGWSDVTRVSLPHLVGLLSVSPEPKLDSALLPYKRDLSLWPKGLVNSPIPLSMDPQFAEVSAKWPSHVAKKVGGIKVEYLKHGHLFYTYRNSLVHEFDEPGAPMEGDSDAHPHYQVLGDGLGSQATFHSHQLLYPLRFFEQICDRMIEGIADDFRKRATNPFAGRHMEAYWIPMLKAD